MPLLFAAVMLAVVPMVTGNLTGLGIGEWPLLYDASALPRLVIAVVLASVAWTSWLWLTGGGGAASVRAAAAWPLLVALAGWSVVSAANSPHTYLAILGQSERLEGVVTFMLYATLYGLGLQVVRSGADLRLLAGAFAISAIALSCYGLLQFAGIDPTSYEFAGHGFNLRRAFATTSNPNFLAGVLLLALPVAWALALSAKESRSARLWSGGSLLILAALFATFTRGAWIALLLELAFIGAIGYRAGYRPTRAQLLSMLISIVLVAGLAAASLTTSGETNIASRLRLKWGGSASERVVAIGVAAAIVADRPLTGYGPGTFLLAFRSHRSDLAARTFGDSYIVNNAHSWPVQAAATLGVPGALLLVSAVGFGLWSLRRAADVPLVRPGNSLIATGVLVGAVGYSAYLMTNVAVLSASVPFWTLLGAAAAPWAQRRVLSARWRRRAAVGALTIAVAAAVAGGSIVAADAFYIRSRLAFHGDISGDAVALAHKATRLDPLSIKYARGLAQASAHAVYREIAAQASADVVSARYRASAELYERALTVDREDYATLVQLASMQTAVAAHLEDEGIARAAAATAAQAALLDRHAADIRPLLAGRTDSNAVIRASNVLPLP